MAKATSSASVFSAGLPRGGPTTPTPRKPRHSISWRPNTRSTYRSRVAGYIHSQSRPRSDRTGTRRGKPSHSVPADFAERPAAGHAPEAPAGALPLRLHVRSCQSPSRCSRDGSHAERAGALACLERLLTATDSRPFSTSAGELDVSVAAGIAHHQPGETVAVLIQRADEALYRAKSQGRDRIVVADEGTRDPRASSDLRTFG